MNPVPMEVRPADPRRDAAVCAAIYSPHVTDLATSFEEVPPGPEEMARRIEAAHLWLVAELGGEVVGWASAGPHRERAAYRWAADVAIYVDAAHRGSGIGRALYQAMFDALRELGIRTVCAGITLPNDASVGLHEALGFELVGVFRSIGYKAGAWRDVGWWQLELVAGDEPPAVR